MHPFYEPNRKALSRKETLPAGLISMLAYLLFWAAAIPIALRALKRYPAPASAQGAPDSALEVLRTRYAKGEIELEEFLQRKHVLGQEGPPIRRGT
jgi:putative membrane protein